MFTSIYGNKLFSVKIYVENRSASLAVLIVNR